MALIMNRITTGFGSLSSVELTLQGLSKSDGRDQIKEGGGSAGSDTPDVGHELSCCVSGFGVDCRSRHLR